MYQASDNMIFFDQASDNMGPRKHNVSLGEKARQAFKGDSDDYTYDNCPLYAWQLWSRVSQGPVYDVRGSQSSPKKRHGLAWTALSTFSNLFLRNLTAKLN